MATRTFKELKPGIDEALQYLKACDDFQTDAAKMALQLLEKVSFPSECSNRREVALHLIGEGFGQLFVKIWHSLCEYLDREKWRQRGYTNLARITGCCHNYTDVCPELGTELGKFGCIPLMLAGLEKLKMYFSKQSEFIIIQNVVGSIFGILHNSIRICSGNREIYRNAGAVNILKSYLKEPISTYALMILAYIVNESESEILAESDVGVATLVQLLQEAVQSSNHTVIIYNGQYFSAFELLDCLNHLAINDDNKCEMYKQDSIPAIVRMLEDDFSEEEQCVAAEVIWNLTFVESIRQSKQVQDALPGNVYFELFRPYYCKYLM